IQSQIKRLNGMIEEVTFAHQMQMGNRLLRLTPVNMHHLLTNIIDELHLVRKFEGAVNLNMHLQHERYMLDEMIVYQIMSNLISNTMKYSDDAGQIDITCKYVDQNLMIAVQDHGSGIHPDDLPHLFEPFHRGKNTGSVSGI